jgi:hypothetical protein
MQFLLLLRRSHCGAIPLLRASRRLLPFIERVQNAHHLPRAKVGWNRMEPL